MKKLVIAGAVIAAFFSITSCNKNNGCPNNSEKAVIRDYSNVSDSCGVIIQTEDGTKLEATNLSEYGYVNMDSGQLVWVKYKEAAGASICGLGEVVQLKCLSEREY
ncbi:hypothetical protein K6119_03225 [Paracrocinitomix mangrovi]|uniref:hypothetical protein n=1 Tax=Paracrocinitomix mangrovi TaxID=2862509 RepID=UPI001C8E3B6F|nr:hypothetical protein [Paracrocinitomix mangrovi]UKN02531.1 hypothetical protein K6119_03225 [Paracrocinitomix mangrovi]